MVVEQMTGLGWGIITLGVIIGVGIILLGTMGSNLANCPTGYAYNTNGSSTFTANTCCLTGGVDCTSAGNHTSASTATNTVNSVVGYLGTTSGGLASWIPLIIILVIGMFFLGAFMVKRGKKA